MVDATTIPSDATFVSYITAIANGKIESAGAISDTVRATMMAYSASLYKGYNECARMAHKLLLATHLPFANYQYLSEEISDALSDCEDEYMGITVSCTSGFSPKFLFGTRKNISKRGNGFKQNCF